MHPAGSRHHSLDGETLRLFNEQSHGDLLAAPDQMSRHAIQVAARQCSIGH